MPRVQMGAFLSYSNLMKDWERYDNNELDRPSDYPDSMVYNDTRRLADLVEVLDFDALFTVEHHFTPLHMTGSTLQQLTYYAGRTKRIDFGTGLIVIPWHHPLRIAEEICFLDNMMDGRKLWLAFGRGSSIREPRAFGIDMNETRARFKEGLEVVKLALTKNVFSYEGEFWNFEDITVRPRPRTKDIVDRMYAGVATRGSLDFSAELGLKLMFVAGGDPAQHLVNTRRFNRIRAKNGLEPMNPLMHCSMYCSEDEDDVEDTLQKYGVSELGMIAKHYGFDDKRRFDGVKGYEEYAGGQSVFQTIEDKGLRTFVKSALFGTPDQIIEKISWMAENLHISHCVGKLQWGDMPVEVAERSTRLYAKEVIPAVKEIFPALWRDEELTDEAEAEAEALLAAAIA
jgi:alkanesulfonate monooxygenase SsuD/methylene tetrahydromethanopterin reductase-like flavin-dependent oxidoreductase (luciferase family)